MNQWRIKLKNIKAILGTNLEKFFLNLKYPEHCKAACIYKNDEYELEVIKKYEPRLYKAVNNTFGESYEYTRRYRDFYKQMKERINKL